MKLSIGIVGSGNLATHLAKRLIDCDYTIAFIHGRNLRSGTSLARRCKCPFLTTLPSAVSSPSLLFICTSDAALSSFFALSENHGYDLIHCSGMQPLWKSKMTRTAVFYPVQTFAKQIEVDWKKIPICIESKDKVLAQLLIQIGNKIGGSTLVLSSKKRAQLHLAAVFANNFVNANYTMAMRILKTQGIPYKLLDGLIHQTAMNAMKQSPADVQTGPAKRKDMATIKAHQQLLKGKLSERKVYDAITAYLLRK